MLITQPSEKKAAAFLRDEQRYEKTLSVASLNVRVKFIHKVKFNITSAGPLKNEYACTFLKYIYHNSKKKTFKNSLNLLFFRSHFPIHECIQINGDISATAHAINLFEPLFFVFKRALQAKENGCSNKLIA